MKKMSRILALVLALALCFSCMAVSVFAEECSCTEKKCTAEAPNGDCPVCGDKDVEDASEVCEYKAGGSTGSEGQPTTPTTPPSSSGSSCNTSSSSSSSKSSSKSSSAGYTPDVSGHYRTSANNILKYVKPVEVAQQELYIDSVTNSVMNLYDSMGNLIPCTLSSDGHFYIVPTNDGYVYIPTGK